MVHLQKTAIELSNFSPRYDLLKLGGTLDVSYPSVPIFSFWLASLSDVKYARVSYLGYSIYDVNDATKRKACRFKNFDVRSKSFHCVGILPLMVRRQI